ncbi:hypothetical protein H0H93_006005 [Arthromyces matolae]|nr:hypothetical protein H0H93_006005 [Arthromyces matolae]
MAEPIARFEIDQLVSVTTDMPALTENNVRITIPRGTTGQVWETRFSRSQQHFSYAVNFEKYKATLFIQEAYLK